MLRTIHVKNMAVIKEEEILFSEGLNILTGETGAGKSILLGSVSLALGEKADRSLIRSGCDQALAELEFTIEDPAIEERLKQMDVWPEDHTITLSRRIMPNRSIARINGETVSTTILAEAASLLIDIHGQRDNLVLLKKRNHREFLDMYAGKDCLLQKKKVEELYEVYKEAEKALLEASMDEAQRARTLDLLNHELREIEAAALKDGEDLELENEYRRLEHGQKIAEAMSSLKQYLSGDRAVTDLLQAGIREITSVSRYDDSLSPICDQLSDAASILQDAEYAVEKYLDDFAYDPMRLDEIQERLDLINHLKSKYGNTLKDVSLYYEDRIRELDKLENYELFLKELEQKKHIAYDSLLEACSQLSSLRKKASVPFAEEIMTHMKELNFASVAFEIQLLPLSEVTADGAEDVEFAVSLNPGESLKPLAKAASGGELSRIMLSIKTVLSGRDEIPTLIFDEIDTGISGRTASKVAEKLLQISEKRQVICITHLPQITAAADRHFLIEKGVEEGHSETRVQTADEKSSIQELARMLGGDVITDTTLQSAAELREMARRKEH